MMKFPLALAGLLLVHAHSAAEILSLQECIDLALRNNLQHQNDYHTLANSHAQLEAARALPAWVA